MATEMPVRPAQDESMTILANFVAFQLGWFACVIGGAHSLPWLGTAVALLIAVWHVARAASPRDELRLLLICAGIGAAFESALVASGWVGYPSGTLIRGTAPHWLVAMWLIFATTLNVSMRWLRHRPFTAAAMGAIGGPLTYWSGERLGGMVFVEPVAATVAMAVGWALLMPGLCRLAQRFDGYAPAPAAA
jgi:hypothetical protein